DRFRPQSVGDRSGGSPEGPGGADSGQRADRLWGVSISKAAPFDGDLRLLTNLEAWESGSDFSLSDSLLRGAETKNRFPLVILCQKPETVPSRDGLLF